MSVFAGLRVIDCASFIAAPAAATVFADFGADVIKIEPPGEGDLYRAMLTTLQGMPKTDINFPWEMVSRSKRSLCLDLKAPEGRDVLYRLVDGADVFITNLPLPARRRLGIGWEDLAARNPRLVYGSFTAYGETGPEADKTGFDSTAYWARSGLMDLVRADASSPPARSVPGMGDHPSAMALFAAIVTALYRRERTGRGGLASSSLLANGLWANGFFAQAGLFGLEVPPRPKREDGSNACTSLYRCADGHWFILTLLNEERQFPALLTVLGLEHLAADPRFADKAARRANARALIGIFDAAFLARPFAAWRAALDGAGITFGPIGTLADMRDDEQMRAAGALVPFAGEAQLTVASPIGLDGETRTPPRRAPTLGQHSAEVLAEAGYGAEDVARLRGLGVLG